MSKNPIRRTGDGFHPGLFSCVVTQTIPVSITRSAYNATYSASYSNAFTDMAEVFTVADGRPPEIPVSEWGSYCEFYATFFVNF